MLIGRRRPWEPEGSVLACPFAGWLPISRAPVFSVTSGPAYQRSQETSLLWIWTHQSPPHPVTVPTTGHIQADGHCLGFTDKLGVQRNKLIFTATQQVGTEPMKSLVLKHPRSSSEVLPGPLISPLYSESLRSRNPGLAPSPELWEALSECLF